jgi:phosphatidylglycerol---prolipoprotein diacylglyceryl transferase
MVAMPIVSPESVTYGEFACAKDARQGALVVEFFRASILNMDMIPYLHIWHFSIPTFGLMLWLAAVAAAFVMDRSMRRVGISADAVGMVATAVVAGIVGAKLWHVLDTPSEFREIGWSVLWDSAGFAWFGGLVFGIAALVLQGWRAGIGGLRTLDLAAPSAAIGYGVGRIGCFLSGDGCYGIPTNLPWGMRFPHGLEPTLVPVHPTPLYELVVSLLIGLWLWKRAARPRPTGWILGEYLVLSGLARFLVEFIRRNPKVLFGLSNAQLASAGSVVVGVVLIIWCATRRAADAKQAVQTVGKMA